MQVARYYCAWIVSPSYFSLLDTGCINMLVLFCSLARVRVCCSVCAALKLLKIEPLIAGEAFALALVCVCVFPEVLALVVSLWSHRE